MSRAHAFAPRTAIVAACLLLLTTASGTAAKTAPRVAAIDWSLTETLIALGVVPVGAAQLGDYKHWTGQPLPAALTDIGLRTAPNLELLSELAPDRILLSRRFATLKPRLARIAPVTVVPLYMGDGPLWPRLLDATRMVARAVSRPAAGERLIDSVEHEFARLKQRLPTDMPPLLLLQFADNRHVRVFGSNSLYGAVLQQLGLRNAWTGDTSLWGYSLVGLDALMRNDAPVRPAARAVIIAPLPPGLAATLPENGLWQRLPVVQRDDLIRLPPVWSIGGLPSARRFAQVLAAALTADPARAPSDD
ncbi:MAG TPA: ABC transporter substrate-binding protein [Gammaproteobacteria bacterium]|nr:ABC transporter substrate-binding protein [Gammaproteobacteria bacterium]